jgi:spore maturation protein CgeB
VNIVILGLSVTSSWGNGHATTYRSLLKGLAARGHDVLFLERDLPWYAGNRDEPHPFGAVTKLYESLYDLLHEYEGPISDADLVILGSFVPDGIVIGEWVTTVAKGVTAFYDIDTPVTMQKLADDPSGAEYISADLIRRFDLYLSFTGGPVLKQFERRYGAPMVRELYCSVDTNLYVPVDVPCRWDLGYLGTWSADRQPGLDHLLLEPARRFMAGRFAVAGPMYPETIEWPANVERTIHLSPREHPSFYGSQRFTLNITREAMKRAGYSPSVRLFEAGACGVPIVSDYWPGLDTIFRPGREVLIASGPDDTLRILRDMPDAERRQIGAAARERVLAEHTPHKRALQLEAYIEQARTAKSQRRQSSHQTVHA